MSIKSLSRLAGCAVFALLCGGCAQMGAVPPGSTLAPVSEVLNQVKDEINAYMARASASIPNPGACYDGKTPMNLMPTSVTVTLRTVASRENDPTVGLNAPLGVLSFNPGYSGSYSKASTQTLTIPLGIPPEAAGAPTQAVAPGPHPLADALATFRDEIIKVDHSKTPCLKFQGSVKISLAFDVVNKATPGFDLKLAIFKIGDKEVISDEAHQLLDVDLGTGANNTEFFFKAPVSLDLK